MSTRSTGSLSFPDRAPRVVSVYVDEPLREYEICQHRRRWDSRTWDDELRL